MESNFFNDVWQQMENYYSDVVVLLPKLFLGLLIFVISYFIANRVRVYARKRLTKYMDDPLLANFIARSIKFLIITVALLIFMKIVGLADVATGLLTGAGVSAIVVGFAFKDIGENFLAGIMLAFNRPFTVGDMVELEGYQGKVVTLNLKNAQIKTMDGKDIYIPNASIIKNPVINYTIDGFLRYDFVVGLDYGSDVGKAIQIILKELKTVPGILDGEKSPMVSILSLSSSTLNLTVFYWLDTFDQKYHWQKVKTEATDKVLTALAKNGFYLPADIVELKNYNQMAVMTSQADTNPN